MIDIVNSYIDSSGTTKTIILIFWLIVGLTFAWSYFWRNKVSGFFVDIVVTGIFYGVIYLLTSIPFSYYFSIYVIPSLLFSIFFFIIIRFISKMMEKEETPLEVKIPFRGGTAIIDTQKGVSVQGAAGSGKTLSVAGWLLEHFGRHNVGGIIYDYKEFEFVEMARYFYRNSTIPLHVFSPFDPERSIQFNPISPNRIKTDEDIKIMSKCIASNLIYNDSKNGDNFFEEAAEGAITGAIYTLREVYPAYCSFTYLIAVFISKDVEELVDFIERTERGKIQARAFLDGAVAAKQMAAVKSTLSNAFSKLANPNIFYCLMKDSVDFSVNESENKAVFCAVNKPTYDTVYEPVLSVVIQSIILKMSERDRDPSYILLDEAPTVRINRISRVPATMRSFKVATIYMLQDMVQAKVNIGQDKIKELLANLSTLFFGKTNDPDTARFFESYFEERTIKQKSFSYKGGSFGNSDKRTNISDKKEKTHRSYEMFKRNPGEFFIFDEKGNSFDAKIKKPVFTPDVAPTINYVTPNELEYNYKMILKQVKKLV